MRKTLIIGALAFVLGGGAVFIYLKHSAHSNSYATMHEMHHGKSGGASQGMMQGHMHDEMTMPGLQGKDTTETEVADLRKISNSTWKLSAESPISPMVSQPLPPPKTLRCGRRLSRMCP